MIRPLDLQMLYMNLDKIGKEQMNSKEAQVATQANQVQKLQKEHDEGAHAVGRTNATTETEGDTSVKVKADGRGNGGGPEPKRPARPAAPQAEPEPETEETWKDPRLGRHVDLSG